MSSHSTLKGAAAGTALRALIAYLVLVYFGAALVSFGLVFAVVVAALVAAAAAAVVVAVMVRALLLRRRGW